MNDPFPNGPSVIPNVLVTFVLADTRESITFNSAELRKFAEQEILQKRMLDYAEVCYKAGFTDRGSSVSIKMQERWEEFKKEKLPPFLPSKS